MKARINDPEFASRMQKLVNLTGNPNRLAKLAGLALPTVNRLLSGQADPSRMSLISLSKATGVCIEWIATGNGPMYKTDKPITSNESTLSYKTPSDMPVEIQPIFEAFMEVMTSNEKGTVLALTQNTYEFREAVRNKKEIAEMKRDMNIIKKRLFAEPREDDFKIQKSPGKENAGGG